MEQRKREQFLEPCFNSFPPPPSFSYVGVCVCVWVYVCVVVGGCVD